MDAFWMSEFDSTLRELSMVWNGSRSQCGGARRYRAV